MKEKIFYLSIVGLTFIILFAISIFNYILDPGNIFHDNTTIAVADMIASGKNVTNLENCNEVDLKKRFIENDKSAPDIVVFGSSRTMGISQSLLDNSMILRNYSVSGARLYNDIDMWYHFFENKKLYPKKVVIGADSWLFNRYKQDFYSDDYKSALKIIDDIDSDVSTFNFNNNIKKYFELFNISYTRASIRKYKNNKLRVKEPEQVDDKFDSSTVLMYDGSLKYSRKENEVNIFTVRDLVQEKIKHERGFQIESYFQMDEEYLDRFEKFIKYLKANNVEVILYLTPYHPEYYDYLEKSDKYAIVIQVENYFKAFAKDNNIKIIGAYDAEKCGLGKDDFMDEMHLKNEAVKKIFKNRI